MPLSRTRRACELQLPYGLWSTLAWVVVTSGEGGLAGGADDGEDLGHELEGGAVDGHHVRHLQQRQWVRSREGLILRGGGRGALMMFDWAMLGLMES
jgi:hypothetical protein